MVRRLPKVIPRHVAWVFEMVPWQSRQVTSHYPKSKLSVCLSRITFVWLAEEELRLSGGGSAYAHRYIY